MEVDSNKPAATKRCYKIIAVVIVIVFFGYRKTLISVMFFTHHLSHEKS